MKRKQKEIWMFAIISILLILFQAVPYIKACKFPDFLDFNMVVLYIALAMPLIIIKLEARNKRLAFVLFSLYLAYFVIALAGFILLIGNPLLNCENVIYIS